MVLDLPLVALDLPVVALDLPCGGSQDPSGRSRTTTSRSRATRGRSRNQKRWIKNHFIRCVFVRQGGVKEEERKEGKEGLLKVVD